MKKSLIALIIVLMFASAALAEGYLSDPMSIGVGARALGMGKAYVGVAEDGDAVFMNPAGLARITNPKLSSMYSSLLGDVNYIVLGGAYPYSDKAAIGAGVINSRVADIPLTGSTGASTGTGSWGNSVIFLSYGTYLSALPLNLNLGRDVLVGGSLKYFSVGGDGAGVSDAAGSGMDVDLGLLYPVNESIMLGANLQNALPASMGGKIVKAATNSFDSIPANLKIGTKINLIGKEGTALAAHSTRRLYGNLDYDAPLSGSAPGIIHAGVEFWPTSNLAIRAGMDDKDLTGGVGIRFSGVEFNYAYHPYSGINENTTQYFSIAYLGEARQRELKIKLEAPADKSITYEDHVKVQGRVEVAEGDEPVKGLLTIKVNGVNLPVAADNTFTADIPVEVYGKKMIMVEATDTAGNSAKLEARLVRLVSFADVPEGYWAKHPIEDNATVGLVQGYPDGNFKPENALTRAELATLLVRAKGIKVEGRASQVFKDVKPTFWAAKYIEIAQREGLVKGYPDKTFRPNNKINKVEGIAVLARFDNLKLAEVDSKPYWDISTKHWGAKYIQAAKDAGMLKFIERNRLRPKEALVRSESVEMLGKTALAGGKIKDLYTWEKGFRPEFTPEMRPQIKASIE